MLQILIPHKNSRRNVLGLTTVIILKRVREHFFFKATNSHHARIEMDNRKKNLLWCLIYMQLFIHFKVISI